MSWRTERYATLFLQKTIFFKTIKDNGKHFFQDNFVCCVGYYPTLVVFLNFHVLKHL